MIYAIEAERSVLGACMLEKGVMEEVLEKTSGEYYSPSNRKVFEVIKALHNDSKPVDIVSVAEKLPGNSYEFTSDLAISVPTTQNVSYYINLLTEYNQRRKLYELGMQLQNKANDTNSDIDSILEYAEKESLSINLHCNDIDTMPEVVEKTLSYIEECHKRKGPGGVKTGFWDLDYMLKGMQPGTLIIIAARPSMGKTAFALNISSHASIKDKHSTIYISAEQTKEQLTTRLLSSRCRIDSNKIKLGQLTDQDWRSLSREASIIANSNLLIDDTTNPKVSEIKTKARKHKADLIIIDHLTELWRERKKEERIEHEANVRDIKRMARDLNIPIILLQQLNRACELRSNKRPILSDLKETGVAEEVADVVIFLYRDEYYNKNTSKKNITEIIIAKGRDIGIGTLELSWVPQYTSFYNLER